MKYHATSIGLIASILLLEVLGWAFCGLEVIPTWQQGQYTVVIITSALAVSAVLYIAVLIWKSFLHTKTLRSAILAIFVAPLGIAVCCFSSWSTVFVCGTKNGFAVAGRELVHTLNYEDYDRTIYVYVYSEIPDGFKKSSLMVRGTWLPIMRHAVSIPYYIEAIQRDNHIVQFRLDVRGEKGNDGILYYDLSTGEYWANLKH